MVVVIEAEQAGQIAIVGTQAALDITHGAAVVFALQLHVHHVIFLLDVVAKKFALLGALVEDLQFLDGVVGQVVEHHLVLTLEEVLAVEGQVIDLLTVDIYVAVVLQLGTGHLADEAVEHRTLGQVEGRGIIDEGIATIGEFYFCAGDHHAIEAHLFIDIVLAALLLLHEDAGQFEPRVAGNVAQVVVQIGGLITLGSGFEDEVVVAGGHLELIV